MSSRMTDTDVRNDCDIPSRDALQSEWNALSYEEQAQLHESFERLCSQGIGDTHRFYSLLMPRALVGYVGD